ncbi:hypothetical protein GMLC_44170 [Geomonas limicola]|uniref:Uncharacterized protein n=1 Tax=Geomonas limicola TaxID=2740186 RepID=A0A6V8NDX2_9BACT|nr:carboxypeptidase-like regulatory domain-containing protein [Geomonas limicola]GFO70838.1 hypothetical protein GMLC_44170 [Geomonas limicola]
MSGCGQVKVIMLAVIVALVGGCGGGGGSSPGGGSAHQISGSVRNGGTGVSGVRVALGGAGNQVVFTNSTGNYRFGGLGNGSYTVSSTKKDYSCLPRSESLTVNGSDLVASNVTATPNPPVFYVVDDTNHLARLDLNAQSVTIIGDTQTFLNDIAFDPNGNLYGISGDQLYRIDLQTAQVTPVGPLGTSDATSLEFSANGTLYTANTALYSINPSTGHASLLGSGGDIQYKSSGDLVFLGNQLFLTSIYNTSSNALVRLNPASGVATLVGTIDYPDVFGLSSNDQVTLYGFSGTKVLDINTTSGKGRVIWDTLGANGLTSINGAAAR